MIDIIHSNIIYEIIIGLMAIVLPLWGGFGMRKHKVYILMTIIGTLSVFAFCRLQSYSLNTDGWNPFIAMSTLWIIPALLTIFIFLFSLCISITPKDKDTVDEIFGVVGEIITLQIFRKK